jgi:hypothetical protein
MQAQIWQPIRNMSRNWHVFEMTWVVVEYGNALCGKDFSSGFVKSVPGEVQVHFKSLRKLGPPKDPSGS